MADIILKCLIVDDEPPARLVIQNYLSKLSNVELIGSAKNAIEAFNCLKKNEIDLIFLDINMPEINGIGLLKMLSAPPIVILTTAYAEYAVESYEYNVADYLLKPIRLERFEKAIGKARLMMQNQIVIKENSFSSDSFEFRTDGKLHNISFDDILYLQSLGNYIRVFTENKTYIVLQTTRGSEEKLPKNIFVRTHKSFIANINKITDCNAEFVIIGNHKLPIGRTYKKYFIEQRDRFLK